MDGQPIGPGQELKRLLRMFGIHPTPECQCEARAIIMDEEGPQWCISNLETIVGWMREEAKIRHMPFNAKGARWMVRRAVHNYLKKLSILEAVS